MAMSLTRETPLMTADEPASVPDPATPPQRRRRWRTLSIRGLLILVAVVATVGLLATLMMRPEFDPGSVRGGTYGTIAMVLCGVGLLVWALGLVRRAGSNLKFRTILAGFTVMAVSFGAIPWLPMPYSIQVGAAVISAVMVCEGFRMPGRPAPAWRGVASRALLGLAGLVGMAMIARNVVRYVSG